MSGSRIFTKTERQAYKFAVGKRAPILMTRAQAVKKVEKLKKELEKDVNYFEKQLKEEGTEKYAEEWETSPVARAEQKLEWANRFLKAANEKRKKRAKLINRVEKLLR
jgi:hypothetical protein